MNVNCTLVSTLPAQGHPVPGTIERVVDVSIQPGGYAFSVRVRQNQHGTFFADEDWTALSADPQLKTAVVTIVKEFVEKHGKPMQIP